MNRRKLLVALVTALLALGIFAPMASAADFSTLKITMNGAQVATDVSPYIDSNNRTMVPVRFISETLGAQVSWKDATRTVTVNGNGTVIILVIDSAIITVNGVDTAMDTAAVITGGRTFVPVRFIAQALGLTVGWDNNTSTLSLTTTTDTGTISVSNGSTGVNSFDFKDKDGYTYHVEYSMNLKISQDTSEGKPGETKIIYDYSGSSISITNTTPGKKSPEYYVDASPLIDYYEGISVGHTLYDEVYGGILYMLATPVPYDFYSPDGSELYEAWREDWQGSTRYVMLDDMIAWRSENWGGFDVGQTKTYTRAGNDPTTGIVSEETYTKISSSPILGWAISVGYESDSEHRLSSDTMVYGCLKNNSGSFDYTQVIIYNPLS